jgi:hypothetical protein
MRRIFLAMVIGLSFTGMAAANGNCQNALRRVTWPSKFTLTIHQSNHTVSYVTGTMRLGTYQSFSQYFNDRSNGPFNPSQADKLGLQIDVEKSQITTTLESWGNGRTVVDLQCLPGTSLMQGVMGNAELTLAFDGAPVSQTVPPPPARGRGIAGRGDIPVVRGGGDSTVKAGAGTTTPAGSPPPFAPPQKGEKNDAVDTPPTPLLATQVTDQYLADTAMAMLNGLTSNLPEWKSDYDRQEASQPTLRLKLAWRLSAIQQLLKSGIR